MSSSMAPWASLSRYNDKHLVCLRMKVTESLQLRSCYQWLKSAVASHTMSHQCCWIQREHSTNTRNCSHNTATLWCFINKTVNMNKCVSCTWKWRTRTAGMRSSEKARLNQWRPGQAHLKRERAELSTELVLSYRKSDMTTCLQNQCHQTCARQMLHTCLMYLSILTKSLVIFYYPLVDPSK